jgi:hypothetical protein
VFVVGHAALGAAHPVPLADLGLDNGNLGNRVMWSLMSCLLARQWRQETFLAHLFHQQKGCGLGNAPVLPVGVSLEGSQNVRLQPQAYHRVLVPIRLALAGWVLFLRHSGGHRTTFAAR